MATTFFRAPYYKVPDFTPKQNGVWARTMQELENVWFGGSLGGLTSRVIPWADTNGTLISNSSGAVWDSTQNYQGIGTSTPLAPLHVKSTVAGVMIEGARKWLLGPVTGANSSRFFIRDESGTTQRTRAQFTAEGEGGHVTFAVGNVPDASDTAGQFTISIGSTGIPGVVFALSSNLGAQVAPIFQMQDAGHQPRLVVNSSFHLGIGTSSPVVALDLGTAASGSRIARLASTATTAVGTTGAGAPTPASPKIYLKTLLPDGTSARIPAYTT